LLGLADVGKLTDRVISGVRDKKIAASIEHQVRRRAECR
jgi:hypothetical protein